MYALLQNYIYTRQRLTAREHAQTSRRFAHRPSAIVLRRTPTKPSAKHIHTHMALPWGKQPSSAVPASGELDVSIVHWGERSARNANLFSPSKLPKDGAAQC